MVFRFLRFVLPLLICGVSAAAQDGRQPAPPTSYSLVLSGLDGVDRPVSSAEFARLPRHDTAVNAHHVEGRYSGVLLSDLLALIHAPAGDSLRGKALATYLRVDGADGYGVVFALADFDPGYTDRIAILADQKDGTPLPSAEGPYHLIVPGERRPARWVRQVVRIEIRRVP
jgi:DMSO/TMAO reductase YedYZ molybdopterin-dependent catalytic subunit